MVGAALFGAALFGAATFCQLRDQALRSWSAAGHESLREITRDDIANVLPPEAKGGAQRYAHTTVERGSSNPIDVPPSNWID
ncbi:MAG: hypothetical protein M0035_09240 [Actinomycetota bacterium]|nr:hypothetical protein [Actinomycetota bacterium]